MILGSVRDTSSTFLTIAFLDLNHQMFQSIRSSLMILLSLFVKALNVFNPFAFCYSHFETIIVDVYTFSDKLTLVSVYERDCSAANGTHTLKKKKKMFFKKSRMY